MPITMEIVRKQQSGKFEYVETVIYTKKEADDLNLYYVYWRDCGKVESSEGDYILTDDEMVVELLSFLHRRDKYGNIRNFSIRTPYMTAYADAGGKNKLICNENMSRNNIGGKTKYDYDGKVSLTYHERLFAQRVAIHFNPAKAMMEVYGYKDEKRARLEAGRKMSKKRIQEVIMQESKDIMKEYGFTPEYMITTLKEWIEKGTPTLKAFAFKDAENLMGLKSQIGNLNNNVVSVDTNVSTKNNEFLESLGAGEEVKLTGTGNGV